jgi:hypothetical protein
VRLSLWDPLTRKVFCSQERKKEFRYTKIKRGRVFYLVTTPEMPA